jgi:hypothetical protein
VSAYGLGLDAANLASAAAVLVALGGRLVPRAAV